MNLTEIERAKLIREAIGEASGAVEGVNPLVRDQVKAILRPILDALRLVAAEYEGRGHE